MPEYDYKCSKGHVTIRIVPASQWKNKVRCSHRRCRRMAEQFLSKAPIPTDPHRIWTASEVHGKKKAASESFAADIEEACFSEKGLQR